MRIGIGPGGGIRCPLLLVAIIAVCCLGAVRGVRGDEYRSQIVELMKRAPADRVRHSQRLSGKIQDASKRDVLVELLKDKSPDVRFGAAELLGFCPKLRVGEVEALSSMLGDNDETVYGNAVWFSAARTLGSDKPPRLEGLKKGLESANPVRRQAAIIGIHFMGEAGHVLTDDIAKLLLDENVSCRRSALGFMRDVGKRAVAHRKQITVMLSDEDFHTQYWAARAIGAMGEAGVPAAPQLINQLENGVASVRRNAALALGKIGPKAGDRAAAALTKSLNDFSVAVREASAGALSQYGELGKKSAGDLRKLLKSSSTETRIAAAQALAVFDLHVDECIDAMLEELKGNQYPWLAVDTIARFKGKARWAVPQLINALKAADPETRAATAMALATIGDSRAVAPLRETLESESEKWVRETAEKALAELAKNGKKTEGGAQEKSGSSGAAKGEVTPKKNRKEKD